MNLDGTESDRFGSGAPRASRLGLQFSVLSLLALTTVSAGVLALVRSLHVPASFKLILAGYAIIMAAYVLLRGFALFRKALRLRREVVSQRREVEAWLAEKRKIS